MPSSSLSLLYLVLFVQATVAANATTTGCPSCNVTPCTYRSVWSILGSCGLTLLICVWHAVHPDLPLRYEWFYAFRYRLFLMLLAFFVPELLVSKACDEWKRAKEIKKSFHDEGFEWWTTTHSYFAIMDGFALRDNQGITLIGDGKLLSLLQAGDVVNPVVTKDDVMDKSSSDGLGKAILILQLFWFAIQLIVRLANHLSVTLVELDTVCMALLTLVLLCFWWEKPCCPERPYIFYHRNLNCSGGGQEKQEGGHDAKWWSAIPTNKEREWVDLLGDSSYSWYILFLTWSLFGALHAIAWHYAFATETERILWRVTSLALTGAPFSLLILLIMSRFHLELPGSLVEWWLGSAAVIGVIARVCLVALMLASLRSLPPSAHEIILWTQYIPHL